MGQLCVQLAFLCFAASVSGFSVVPVVKSPWEPALLRSRIHASGNSAKVMALQPRQQQATIMMQESSSRTLSLQRTVLVAGASGRVGAMVCEQVRGSYLPSYDRN